MKAAFIPQTVVMRMVKKGVKSVKFLLIGMASDVLVATLLYVRDPVQKSIEEK
jgi:hypothetical protein